MLRLHGQGGDQGEQRVLADVGGGGERGERPVRLRPRDQLPVHPPGTVDPRKVFCTAVSAVPKKICLSKTADTHIMAQFFHHILDIQSRFWSGFWPRLGYGSSTLCTRSLDPFYVVGYHIDLNIKHETRSGNGYGISVFDLLCVQCTVYTVHCTASQIHKYARCASCFCRNLVTKLLAFQFIICTILIVQAIDIRLLNGAGDTIAQSQGNSFLYSLIFIYLVPFKYSIWMQYIMGCLIRN